MSGNHGASFKLPGADDALLILSATSLQPSSHEVRAHYARRLASVFGARIAVSTAPV
jgi:hypothetical protein